MRKARNSFLSAVFSFLSPGLGQLYRGEPRKAVSIVIGFVILILAAAFLFDSLHGFGTVIAAFLGLFLWNVWDASSRSITETDIKWYHRWYIYVCWFVITNLGGEFVKIELRQNYYQAFKILSEAMTLTLRTGDNIMVSKRFYDNEPIRRGDVIVLRRDDDVNTQEDESHVEIVKRVIGLPGERVAVRGAQVFINDRPIDEPYARWTEGGISEGNFGPATVPQGTLFLLGDNRDRSRDSRFWPEVFIPTRNVIGRVVYIYWSRDSLDRIREAPF